MVCCFALSIISPFFPPYAKEKGINEGMIGLIFTANPIGSVLASLIMGKILTDVKVKFYSLIEK
jgi:MFS family permease